MSFAVAVKLEKKPKVLSLLIDKIFYFLTNKVHSKETNEQTLAEIRDWAGFEPKTPGHKAKTITTELRRILLNPFPNNKFKTLQN